MAPITLPSGANKGVAEISTAATLPSARLIQARRRRQGASGRNGSDPSGSGHSRRLAPLRPSSSAPVQPNAAGEASTKRPS